MAQSPAIAADSVGLKTPDQMPPSNITGNVKGSAARQSTSGTCDQDIFCPNDKLRFWAIMAIHIIKLNAISKPGTTPAKNNAPNEAVLISA